MENVSKYNYDHNSHRYHPVGPSCTVPDDSYTIKELIQRYNAGAAPTVHEYNEFDINPINNGTVDDLYRDVSMVDPRLEPNRDLVDRVAAAEAAKANIERLLEAHRTVVSEKSEVKTEENNEGKPLLAD